ncbi:MAG TPA: hypothetical protein EYO33_03450 [Phycisphaerales bacterium]|nr:hypothetical protein [Phycisphaerales bacterium]
MSLERYKDLLSDAVDALPDPSQKLPDINDPYVARSALQKALRRGDVGRAEQAARSLLNDPQRLWKGLGVTVFEDFGSVPVDVRGQVVTACASKKVRSDLGGDLVVTRALIGQLCDVPRDRRVDEAYMFAGVLERSPLTARQRRRLSPELKELLDRAGELIRRCERPVPRRSFKTVLARECDAFLVEMYEAGCIDEEELVLCIQGRKTTQCLLPVLYPLTRPVSPRQRAFSLTVACPAGTYRDTYDIPLYALDGYTRTGSRALELLFWATPRLQSLLKSLKSRSTKMKALAALLFVVEGGVCAEEVSDPLYDELKHVSRGRWSGLPAEMIPEALEAMLEAIPHLNQLRQETWGS